MAAVVEHGNTIICYSDPAIFGGNPRAAGLAQKSIAQPVMTIPVGHYRQGVVEVRANGQVVQGPTGFFALGINYYAEVRIYSVCGGAKRLRSVGGINRGPYIYRFTQDEPCDMLAVEALARLEGVAMTPYLGFTSEPLTVSAVARFWKI
jgi:hypothetical protein